MPGAPQVPAGTFRYGTWSAPEVFHKFNRKYRWTKFSRECTGLLKAGKLANLARIQIGLVSSVSTNGRFRPRVHTCSRPIKAFQERLPPFRSYFLVAQYLAEN